MVGTLHLTVLGVQVQSLCQGTRDPTKTNPRINKQIKTHTYVGNGFLRKVLRPFHGKRVFRASGAGATAYSHSRE